MATQENMYRESQKTNAKLEQVASLLAKQKAGGVFSESGIKKLEALQKEAEKANESAIRRETIEKKLLGQNERQYNATLKQRKAVEDSQKKLSDLEDILGSAATNNKRYQNAQLKLEKEKSKLAKREARRSLFRRFKDAPAALGQSVKNLRENALPALAKTFDGVLGFIKRLGGIFALLILPALALLVNSPYWGMLKQKIKDLIDWFAAPDNPVINFFSTIIDGFKDIFSGNFKEGFLKIGKAFDDAITRLLKNVFGLEFEGNVSDVIKKFIAGFLAGIANILPGDFFGLKSKLLGIAAELDPAERERQAAKKQDMIAAEQEKERLDIGGEDEETIERELSLQAREAGNVWPMVQAGALERAVLEDLRKGNISRADAIRQMTRRGQGLGSAGAGRLEEIRKTERLLEGADEQATLDSTPEERRLQEQITENKATRERLQKLLERRMGRISRLQRTRTEGEIEKLTSEISKLNSQLKIATEARNDASNAGMNQSPIIVDASQNNVSTATTQNSASHSPALRQGGSLGHLSSGGGSMAGAAFP